MEEKEVLVNNSRVNYKIAGQGQPILILHGWGGSSDSWIRIIEILTNQGYQVICPDLPAFGKSITPPQPWGISDYSDFVLNLIKKLELSDFFLLGHSFGGMISVKIATKYPKIKSLILCAAAGIKSKPGFKTKIVLRVAKFGNAIFALKPLERFKDRARNFFYAFLRHRDYVKAGTKMKETLKNILKVDLLPDLSKIKVKTLLIWGEKDKIIPLRKAYIFKENIPNSKLEILPKIGHSPHLEAPEKLSKIIIKNL